MDFGERRIVILHGKLRERNETQKVVITVHNEQEATFDDLVKNAKQKGFLFFPYHCYIDADGECTKGRDDNAIASIDIGGTTECYTVLVDAPRYELMTNKQHKTLALLLVQFEGIQVEIREV